MNPIERLRSVLCDPEGKCCIHGSDEDRRIVDEALRDMAEAWRASREAGEPVLDKHAQIGGTIFGPGIKCSSVVSRAQREYEYHRDQDPKRYEKIENLRSLLRPDAAPAGDTVQVPREPTQVMCQAGQEKAREWPKFPLRISAIYRAMLAAAPSAQKGEEAQGGSGDAGEQEDNLVTMTIVVARSGNITSDVLTHDNSFADVASGLAQVKAEVERVFSERKKCPYYPKSADDFHKKIIRSHPPGQDAHGDASGTRK